MVPYEGAGILWCEQHIQARHTDLNAKKVLSGLICIALILAMNRVHIFINIVLLENYAISNSCLL